MGEQIFPGPDILLQFPERNNTETTYGCSSIYPSNPFCSLTGMQKRSKTGRTFSFPYGVWVIFSVIL